ncbi:hypothetical protein Taro_047756 [Colocasia esculenta]|uniref:CMP/dCMP-type deaminase domain-containing protein n=1 Tax=Colocasia esculenta TaxID=4460 RepID=A0A843WWA3_COLES|nr:hypothetical protein [Colocasia esculenta]
MISATSEFTSSDLAFMEFALEQAKSAMSNLEVPVGCVFVEDGEVISSGSNRTNETRNATRHAEMEAIDLLLERWQKAGLSLPEVTEKFSKCVLYVTCEPCIMCAAALSILGIKEVFYGCANDKFGGCGSILSLHEGESEQPSGCPRGRFRCRGGLMASEAVGLLRSFYEHGNPNAPKPHRPDPSLSKARATVPRGDAVIAKRPGKKDLQGGIPTPSVPPEEAFVPTSQLDLDTG